MQNEANTESSSSPSFMGSESFIHKYWVHLLVAAGLLVLAVAAYYFINKQSEEGYTGGATPVAYMGDDEEVEYGHDTYEEEESGNIILE